MGKRFLHNRAAVITVAVVLLIGLIGILAPVLAPTTLMLLISSTNSRLTAWSTPWVPTIWVGASSPG